MGWMTSGHAAMRPRSTLSTGSIGRRPQQVVSYACQYMARMATIALMPLKAMRYRPSETYRTPLKRTIWQPMEAFVAASAADG